MRHSEAIPERFRSVARIIPELFRTSRARADQGTREQGAGIREEVASAIHAQVGGPRSWMAADAADSRWTR